MMLLVLTFCTFNSQATTYHSRATGNWATNTTWSLTQGGPAVGAGIFPITGDIVYIYAGFNVTVAANAACASIQLGATPTTTGNLGGTITMGAFTLDVTGNIAIGGAGNANRTGTIVFANGSAINAGSITLGNSGTTPAPGTITMTAGGTINLGGSFTVNTVAGNTWTPGTGTVNFTANNTLPTTIFTSFHNLTVTSGTTTLGVSLNSTATGTITIKAGATLALSTFSYGATTAPAGLTLECGATTGSTISGSGSLSLGGNVTVNNVATGNNGAAINCPIALTGTRTFTVADDGTSATDLTLGAVVSGAFGITKLGAGKLTPTGTNTYTGITTVNAGTLSLAIIGDGGVAGNMGQATNAAANWVMGGGTIEYTGSTASTNRNFTLTAATTNTFNITTNTLTISGASTNTTGLLTKTGAGILILSGANLYTGITTINEGILRAGINSAISTGGVTVNDGGTFDLNGFSESIGALIVNSGATGGTVTTGAGTLTLGGNITSTGGASNATISGNIALGLATRTITLTNAADGLTISAIISGIFGITKAGAGKLTLSGLNTYTGITTLSAGTMSVSNIGNAGVAGNIGQATNVAANWVMGTGTFEYTGATASTNRNYTINATTTCTMNIVSNTLTISGASIATTGALTKTGTGTLVLAGTNLNTGITTINAGILQEGITNAIATGAVTVNDGGTFDLNGFSDGIGALTVNSGATGGNVITGAGTLTIGGSITSSGGATNASISGNIALTATRTFAITNAADGLTVSAIISGAGGITKNGAGKLTLTGTNTFTGVTTISAGTLSVATIGDGGVAGNMGQASTGSANWILGGGTLEYTGATATTNRNFRLSNLTTSTFDITTNTLTISGASTNLSGGLVKNGNGTLILSGANSYNGITTINAGILREGANNAIDAGDVIVNDGGTFDLNGFSDAIGALTVNSGTVGGTVTTGLGTLTLGGNITSSGGAANANISGNLALGATRIITATNASDGLNISALISGATFGITKAGAGTLTLSGNNTYTGATTINAGVLSVATIGDGGVAGNMGQATNVAANWVLGGGTIQYTGATASTNRNFTLTAATTNTFDITTNTLTISGASTNTTGALTKIGAGTLIFTGTNLYTGLTTVTAGTLQLGVNNAISNGNVTVNGGTLNLGTFTETIGTLTLTSGSIESTTGTLTATSFGVESGTISAILAGNAPLTKTTSGTVTLSGVNTYTGVTTITAGVLSVATIGNGGVAGNLGQATNSASNLIFNGGTLQYTGLTATTNRNFTLTAAITSSIDITTNTLTISGASTNTTGALSKIGSGTLILSGANLFTGTLTVADGTLQLGANNALSTCPVSINGGTLNIATFTDAVGAVTLVNGTISGTTGVLTGTSYDLQNGTVSGILSGSIGVTKSTSGSVVLSGANLFTGTIAIQAGTLNLQNNQAAGTSAGGVNITSGADLELEGGITISNETLSLNGLGTSGNGALINISGTNSWGGAITVAGTSSINSTSGTLNITNTISLSTNALTIEGASTNSNTISGIISGSGLITKSGTGRWVLSATNLNSGGVTLDEGTICINNAQALGTTAGTFQIGGSGNTIAFDNTSGSSITTLNYPMSWRDNFTFTGTNALNLGTGAVAMTSSIVATINSNTLTVGGVISGATFGLTKAGGGTLTLTGTNTFTGGTTMNAGTLNINNTQALGTAAGTFTIAGGTIDNTSGGDITTLNYPLAFNGDFTYSASVPRNLNLGTGTIIMNGDRQVTVSAGSLTMGGALSQATMNFTKAGAGILRLESNPVTLNSLVISAGTLVATSSHLTLSGDFTNNATFNNGAGTIVFNSASAQSIGGSSVSTFNNLSLLGGGAKTLNTSLTVDGALVFSNGLLNTTASNLLSMSAGSSVSSASNSSFVNGPIKKTGNTGFVFPVGKSGTGYQAIEISAPSLVTDAFTAEYMRVDATTIGTQHIGPITTVSKCEYWQLDISSGAPTVDVTLYANSNSGCGSNTGVNYLTGGATPLSAIRVIHWNGTAWENATAGSTSFSGTSPDVTVTASAVTNFSPFTFGSIGFNPLPIKLLDINAWNEGNKNLLHWRTASELNNAYFAIEKSIDGIQFNEIGRTPGARNSSTILNYDFIDSNLIQQSSTFYYRLKQVDFNGSFDYSKIVTVQLQPSSKIIILDASPNPAKNKTNVLYNLPYDCEVTIQLFNSRGRLVFTETKKLKKGRNKTEIDVSALVSGVYTMNLISDGGCTHLKVVKEND